MSAIVAFVLIERKKLLYMHENYKYLNYNSGSFQNNRQEESGFFISNQSHFLIGFQAIAKKSLTWEPCYRNKNIISNKIYVEEEEESGF